MDEQRKLYPVRSPLRHNGTRYKPGENAPLAEAEAASLASLNIVGPDPVEDENNQDAGNADAAFDLIAALASLIESGHAIKDMSMKDITPLLGEDGKDIRRADVDAALQKLEENED